MIRFMILQVDPYHEAFGHPSVLVLEMGISNRETAEKEVSYLKEDYPDGQFQIVEYRE